ncbi:hypothetical protein Ntsu_70300 [Nocardia sp. IFM 10818]
MGKAVVAVAAMGLAAGSVIGAGSANAAGLYGAIAFSDRSWTYGSSVNAPSHEASVDEAVANCAWDGATDCTVMVAWANGCGALVYSDANDGMYRAAAGTGPDRATALRNAYARLAEHFPLATLANTGSAGLSQTGVSEVVCTANAR